MAEVTWEPLCLHTRGRPRRISRQKFPKRTRILSIPSKPYSFHSSVHSAIGSRMNGMIFRSFRKQNSSQKNTNTVYSEYSYSGIVSKERTLNVHLESWVTTSTCEPGISQGFHRFASGSHKLPTRCGLSSRLDILCSRSSTCLYQSGKSVSSHRMLRRCDLLR